jgi:hypothetical protein
VAELPKLKSKLFYSPIFTEWGFIFWRKRMKNKWLKIIAIIVAVGMITAPAFARTDPTPVEPPPSEPDPPPAITAPRSNPEGCTSNCFAGIEADKQMREVTGYISPVETKLLPVEEKISSVEEPAVAKNPQGQEAPKPIPVRELLRSLEDSSM